MPRGRDPDDAGARAAAPDDDAAPTLTDELASDHATRAALAHEAGDRPLASRLARAAARARVAGKLFALAPPPPPVKVGRYHVLEVVGAGGMGVVLGAWDPELERRVAIKLVKAATEAARARILAEGQALAKVSHPNVVAVFDVGVVDDRVYLVMEWIKGDNLRVYCQRQRPRPPTVRELVGLYRQCADGLAAAHAGGLIHRDFKPDNALVGEDGRVRVLDFGLARDGGATGPDAVARDASPDADPISTRGAGTPRYMAPEQRRGDAVTAAVDQFALGVALRESLERRGGPGASGAPPAPVPRWLAAIITRATVAEAAARYPSMRELERALGRDPATLWRRRGLVAAAAATAAGAFVAGSLRQGDAPPPCAGGAAELAGVWSAAIGADLRAHMATLGSLGAAEAAQLERDLDGYAGAWLGSHRGACLAHRGGELPATLYERRLLCLARSRGALAAAVEVVTGATTPTLADALIAARSLPDPACADEVNLTLVDPPAAAQLPEVRRIGADVEAARVRALAVSADAPRRSAQALADALHLGYPWLVARAELVDGMSHLDRDPGLATDRFRAAEELALHSGDDDLAVEAFARLVYRRQASEAAADLGRAPAVQALARRRTVTPFSRALLANNLGTAALAAREPGRAEGLFRAALAEAERMAPPAPELLVVHNNLALVSTDDDQRTRLIGAAVERATRALGPRHPLVLAARVQQAQAQPASADAAAGLEQVCTDFIAHAAYLREDLAMCAFELASLRCLQGDAAGCRAWLARVDLDDYPGPLAARLVAWLDAPAAAPARQAVVDHAQALLADDAWWQRPGGGLALVLVGTAPGPTPVAGRITLLRAAVAGLASVASVRPAPHHQRRLAHAQAHLALLLPPAAAETRELAAAARAWFGRGDIVGDRALRDRLATHVAPDTRP